MLRPPFAKQVNSPYSSPSVRPLKMSNPASQHRFRSSWPQPPTLVSRFCRVATTLGYSILVNSSNCNSSQRSLVSMVSSSAAVRTLKSPPISTMPPTVSTSAIFATRFWNRDSFSCLKPIKATYTMQTNKSGAAPLLTHSHR